MENWRRNRSEYYNPHRYQSGSKCFTRSQYRKPPQPPPPEFMQPEVPAWVHSVPSWERKFVTNVGKMPWGRFVHCQKSMDLYNDIFQWDDSAGGEAFHNAKSRFWAEFNRLPCDIPLPDPDMYTDQIDWNVKSDLELFKDLEELPVVPDEEERYDKTGFVDNSFCYTDQPIIPTGWGDEPNLQDDDNKPSNKDNPWFQTESSNGGWGSGKLSSLMKPIISPGCGDDDSCMTDNNKSCNPLSHTDNLWNGNRGGYDGDKKTSNKDNQWEGSCGGWDGDKKTTNRDNPWDESCGGWDGDKKISNKDHQWGVSCGGWDGDKTTNTIDNSWEGNQGGWEGGQWGSSDLMKFPSSEPKNPNYWDSGSWRRGNENWRKRESEGQQLSRYKTTRYQGHDYQTDQGRRNYRGKARASFAHEHSPVEPLASRQWNSIQTCGPIAHHRPGEAKNSWGW